MSIFSRNHWNRFGKKWRGMRLLLYSLLYTTYYCVCLQLGFAGATNSWGPVSCTVWRAAPAQVPFSVQTLQSRPLRLHQQTPARPSQQTPSTSTSTSVRLAGFGSRLAEALRDEYPQAYLHSVAVAPSRLTCDSPMQHYNAALCLAALDQCARSAAAHRFDVIRVVLNALILCSYSDCVLYFDNDELEHMIHCRLQRGDVDLIGQNQSLFRCTVLYITIYM